MNILVLGETGVGKSTFINGLVNYLKYGSMDDAMGGGVEILIKSTFTLTDDNVSCSFHFVLIQFVLCLFSSFECILVRIA